MNLGSWPQTHHKGKGTYCQQEKSRIIRGLVGGKWHEPHTRYQGPHSAPPPQQFKGSHISSLRVPHVPSPDLCTCCFLSLDWPPLQMPSRLYLPCQTPLCTQELCITTATSSSSRKPSLIPFSHFFGLAYSRLKASVTLHNSYMRKFCHTLWRVWSLKTKAWLLFIRIFPAPSQCPAHSRQTNQCSILPSNRLTSKGLEQTNSPLHVHKRVVTGCCENEMRQYW